jgi:hypothetical protein
MHRKALPSGQLATGKMMEYVSKIGRDTVGEPILPPQS